MSSPACFADRMSAAVEEKRTCAIVGIDPHLDLLPPEFAAASDPATPRLRRASRMGDFCCELLEVVAPLVPAVKPQSAFFEALGAAGAIQWERVVRRARELGLLVIGDVKRGDISTTARAYATAFLEGGGDPESACDAITLSPFLGSDSIEPFLDVCARTATGVFVLVRTSNPGSADFQRHGEPELSFAVAARVARWGERLMGEHGLSSVGAVVGATHARELAAFRECMPRTPFLLPGYGAQGASARDLSGAFTGPRRGALVNSSRGIAFASKEPRYAGLTWQEATLRATHAMIDDLKSLEGVA
ncbi:MAG TPA: orotidine-5'-phosphate decarboxylase [Planctomycetota bacterium]|nr:orotidine-5'-phosphate decarboxylase [Planctomycetota bacterium]